MFTFRLTGSALIVAFGMVKASAQGPSQGVPDVEARPNAGPRPAAPAPAAADVPPPCSAPRPARPAQPAPGSMPEMFARMGERFARDPMRGFQGFLDDLAGLEGPALKGIRLSPAEERRAGQQARAEYLRRAARQGYRVVDDRAKQAYLRELVEGFARRMTHRDRYPHLDITLIAAPVPDGQSFPGGYLVFTTALLDEPDEATVAAVVAHELAHLDRGHLYEYARRGKLAESTFQQPPGAFPGAPSFDQFFARGMTLFGLMMNPFRPEHEHEADCVATTWLYLDGYDPMALVEFFERLHDRLRDQQPQNTPFPVFAFGRSHPYSLERRAAVLSRIQQLRRWQDRDDLGRFPENLRNRSSHFRDLADAP